MNAAALWPRLSMRRRPHRSWLLRNARHAGAEHGDLRSANLFSRVTMPLIGALMAVTFLAAVGLVVFVGARQNAVARELAARYLAASVADDLWRAGSVLNVMAADPEVQAALEAGPAMVPEFRNALGLGLSGLLAQNRGGQTVLALGSGGEVPLAERAGPGPGEQALMDQARRAGPGRAVFGYVLSGGEPMLLAAVAIPAPRGDGEACCAVILISQPFGRAVRASDDAAPLSDLQVVESKSAARAGQSGALLLPVPEGLPPLTATWTAGTPGALLLKTVLPAMAVVGVVLAGVTWGVLRRASMAARRLAGTARALEAANAELAAVANTDGLTGLANRRYFDVAFGHEWRRSRRDGSPISLLMIDVDRFKAFNDRHGHVAGDVRLRLIADAISGSIRRPGDVAARYGGEEFAVLLPATGAEGAMRVAETMRAAVAGLSDAELGPCSVSIGVASVRPADDYPALLVQAADSALYLAKNGGRNQVRLAGTALLPRQR